MRISSEILSLVFKSGFLRSYCLFCYPDDVLVNLPVTTVVLREPTVVVSVPLGTPS